MRAHITLLCFVMSAPSWAQDELQASAPAQPPSAILAPALSPEPKLSFTDDAIKRAVHEVLAEEAAKASPASQKGPAFSAARSPELRKFDTLVEDGFLPNCLQAEGLKRQPTGWGPFQLHGYAALPFIVVAKLRGVCR